ncbi:PIKK family atypical protein kinase [Histomonas meleagridis]|uniref:PIKK family atypical protein kinase n=1 Tax=Histomonas meleagridis TaxID=135588 RepID=UPI003559C1FD|nr:PIKK family atypical protein kinase [Histomonas meleagridis]KAH0798895.1 PIKK family atypical protein kinase [Histomonas meleagridis]
MEVLQVPIPIDIKTIAIASYNVGFLEQSLRAYETLFAKGDNESTENLIQINQKLGLTLAANGILRSAKPNTPKDVLSEKLGLWKDALNSYELKLKESPNDSKLYHRKLHCLKELLKFKELNEITLNSGTVYEASAAWNLMDYERFKNIVEKLNEKDEKYFKAIYYLMIDEFDKSKEMISLIQNDYIDKLFPIISEDYERIISDFSYVSSISLLEQAITYKKMLKLQKSPIPNERNYATKRIDNFIKKWDVLFNITHDETGIMYQFLTIETFILGLKQTKNHFIRFIEAAIDKKDFSIASSTIQYLQSKIKPTSKFNTKLKYYESILKREESKPGAVSELSNLISTIKDESFLSKAITTLCDWLIEDKRYPDAYELLKNNGNIIHNEASLTWSRVNMILYEVTKEPHYLSESFKTSMDLLSNFSTISSPLTYALRVLSTLFRKGNTEIYEIFETKVSQIPVHIWVEVIPQLIARLTSGIPELRRIVNNLICSIGEEHPQVVLYSLLVPYKSDNSDKSCIAKESFDKLRLKYPVIVDGVLRLARELMRVAVSWWEIVQNNIDDASRAFFVHKDPEAMLSLLAPLHEISQSSPKTFYEVSFLSQFGQTLYHADRWMQIYKEKRDERALHQSWQLLIILFNKLRGITKGMDTVPLEDASPLLYNLNNCEIAVPGMYAFNEQLITIQSFKKTLHLIKSKQRPRKMGIYGNNGQKYTFLLKANEDTRLDERVMQLFSYINTLVESSNFPLKSRLTISTYKVIPLTVKVGLIGWVPQCTTLFDLIKQYRAKHGIQIEEEYINIKKMFPNYDNLPLSKKREAFEKGLASNDGNDIKHLLFEGARSSHDWLERRTNYSTSLAMNSMAGYILGLGDRHLCNIMMNNKTAKLVHIDFGDCFEVATKRESYPEKVPFRLTRVLVNGLEVSQIEGTFRSCCENSMSLLRSNGAHIMELLEAFIYDPLMQWTENEKDEKNSNQVIKVVNRILDKLNGRDFLQTTRLKVTEQVNALINQAMDPKNLCRMFKGWSPWL